MHGENKVFAALSRFCSRRAWLVIACWVALVGVLNLGIPQLEHTVAERSVPFLPHDLTAAQTLREMADAFGVARSSGIGSVVLVDENGISDADRQAYRQLVDTLRADTANVAFVLDPYGTESLRNVGISPDGKAINVVVSALGDVGSPEAHRNTAAIRALIDKQPKPAGLQIHYTGPSPILADLFSTIDLSLLIITAVSVVVIAMVLLLVYRSAITALIPLVTIGVALGVARPVISLLGLTDTLAVSNFTIALMTALVLGATTDYAIFVLAGYHEGRRKQVPVADSLTGAAAKVNGVLIASALTIAAAATAMGFTQVGLFRASGPPIVVAIIIALAVSLTVPYALIAVFARRGFVEPRRFAERRWRRIGAKVIRRSRLLATASLIFLIAAASPLLTFRPNFDESAMLIGHHDSVAGYDAVYRHWGVNDAAPEYLIVRNDHDMRNTTDLAALDEVASAVSKMPEVAYVRFLTRPDGHQLEQTTIGYQAGMLAKRLGEAEERVQDSNPDLTRLANGVAQLHDGAAAATTQIPELVNGIRQLSALARSTLATYQSADAATQTLTGGVDIGQVLADLTSLQTVIDTAVSTIADDPAAMDAIGGLDDALGTALTPQPGPDCLANPMCMRARADLADLDAMSNGAVSRVLHQTQAIAAVPQDAVARIRNATQAIHANLTQLQSLLGQAQAHSPKQTDVQLTELVRGAEQLSSGMSQLASGLAQVQDGVGEVVGLSGQLGDGLKQAADYLQGLSAATSDGPAAGFYLPPQGFSDENFRAGANLLLSADGKTARMVVVWKINPYSEPALDAAHKLANIASRAASSTSLHTASFATTGLASMSADMRDEVREDFAVCAFGAMLGVLVVLIVLLRSILAPVFMVAIVALSFAAAAGVSVLVWQYIIGIDLDWSVLPVSFMALIAVGADYSLLFAARIREASQDGMIRGIIRGFGSTGGVITTAGVVFALTMFALMSGRVFNLVQIGFMVGIGLLIDITVVRTVLVPAALAMIGDRIWWPSNRAQGKKRPPRPDPEPPTPPQDIADFAPAPTTPIRSPLSAVRSSISAMRSMRFGESRIGHRLTEVPSQQS